MTHDVATDSWGVTEKTLRAQLRSLRSSGAAGAVATVAAVDGSAYRRPGAKLLVQDDGESLGAVTAGCLEPDAIDRGRSVIESGTPQLSTFDLRDDSADGWGLGLGCNGVIDLFVEPLDASWDPALDALADGRPVTMVTVIESEGSVPVGSRVLVVDGTKTAVPERPPIPATVFEPLADSVRQAAKAGSTRTVAADSGTTLLVDHLDPVPELLVFGSQQDVSPLVRLATQTGFHVTVHSPRGAVDAATFPAADTVTTGHPTTIGDAVDTDGHTYAVVMSHNLVDDRLAVETLLTETAVPYVGLMGPRDRFERIRDRFEADEVTVDESALDRIATPIGLDLGGGSPVEISLSIVSEVLAVSNGCDGRRLSDHAGPIHPRR